MSGMLPAAVARQTLRRTMCRRMRVRMQEKVLQENDAGEDRGQPLIWLNAHRASQA